MEKFEEFEQLESDLNLFDIEINSVPIWERIRAFVFSEIQKEAGYGQANTYTNNSLLKPAKLGIRNIFLNNPFITPNKSIVFIGSPRRKKESDGMWWDIYCDPIYDNFQMDYVYAEKNHNHQHKKPAKTDSIRYLDLIEIGGSAVNKLWISNIEINKNRPQLKELENQLLNRFNVETDIVQAVENILENRRIKLWLYQKLLNRINPNIVVIVCSYGNEIIIEACKSKGIPTAEIQHGVIRPNHPGYSFTGDRTKVTFPDYLLTRGKFWSKGIEFPIPKERVIPVGYPYIEQNKKEYQNVCQEELLLFISQGTIGEQLSKFAVKVNQCEGIDLDIVYKLHPGEYAQWKNKYPWLLDSDIVVVDGPDPPLYKLFARAKTQVGVYSTAIYEGLYFGLETYIYDCIGSNIMSNLVNNGCAEIISSTSELSQSLGRDQSGFNIDYYFASKATKRSRDTILKLSNEGTVYETG